MPAFTRNNHEKLIEIDRLVDMDSVDAEDENSIEAFYNGRETMTDAEADDLGVKNVVNHLFGFDQMATVETQLVDITTKDPNIWHIEIQGAPPEQKDRWEQRVTFHMNNAIRRSRRFTQPWKSVAGGLTLHGRAVLGFTDDYDWCPKMMRPLVPPKTGILARDIPFAVIPGRMTLKEIEQNIAHAEARKGETSWKLSSLIEARNSIQGLSGTQLSNNSNRTTEIETGQNRMDGVSDADANRLGIPVYYFYEARPDDPKKGFDLTILARYHPLIPNPQDTTKKIRATHQVDIELFQEKQYFERSEHWMHPFFMDTSIGQETTWHKVQGLGKLNYDSDVEVERLFNDGLEGAKENLRRLYTVANAGDLEMLERWISEPGLANILPEGVGTAEIAKNPNFQFAFQFIEMMRQNSSKNAQSSVSNTGEKGVDELEVQALERQGRSAAAVSAKMNSIYAAGDHLGEEIFRRISNPNILPIDSGYEEAKFFQDCVRADGIPLEFLRIRSKAGDRFKNVIVKMNRTAGDGNKVGEIMVNRMLLERLPLFNPQAQQVILRRVVAAETKDHDLAELLVPRQEEIDSNQTHRANNENDACWNRGINDYIPPIMREDIHIVHVPEHLGGMQAMVTVGQTDPNGWGLRDFHGFRCLGAHTIRHIQAMQANPQQRQQAQAFMQALQDLAGQGEQLMQAFQAKQQQQELSQMEQAKIQDMQQKAQLAARAQGALEQHRAQTLDQGERKLQSSQAISNAQQAQSEIDADHSRQNADAQLLLTARRDSEASKKPAAAN